MRIGPAELTDRTFGAKWLVDAEVVASFSKGIRRVLGADNLFDLFDVYRIHAGLGPDVGTERSASGSVRPLTLSLSRCERRRR